MNLESTDLTKYPSASFKELVYLSLPLILSLFSSSFMGFCDRLFLARYSVLALEASVSAGYLTLLFQQPIIRIVTMTIVFVGLYRGSKQNERIGNSVWQMIWLSFASMLITYPVSLIVAPFFFGGTVIQAPASTYFSTIMAANFLYPLATTLSAYYIGQGRMRAIFLTTLLSHGLNVGLDALFIFGLDGFVPSMGIFGAALATVISQALFCIILFCMFLRKKERILFRTDNFRFNWLEFWEQFRTGLPRAIGRVIILTAWVLITRLMTLMGGDHLMVLSIGGTLILLFTFINDGMCQGIITVASNILGTKNYPKIWHLVRSSLFFLLITTSILAIPYLFMPKFLISFFFPNLHSAETFHTLRLSCIWLWLFFFAYGFNAIGLSLITASRDVTFYLLTICFIWFTAYLPVHIGMHYLNWSPDKLWLIMACDSIFYGIIFLIRASKEKWKETPIPEAIEAPIRNEGV